MYSFGAIDFILDKKQIWVEIKRFPFDRFQWIKSETFGVKIQSRALPSIRAVNPTGFWFRNMYSFWAIDFILNQEKIRGNGRVPICPFSMAKGIKFWV
jgi:hypothetical protein